MESPSDDQPIGALEVFERTRDGEVFVFDHSGPMKDGFKTVFSVTSQSRVHFVEGKFRANVVPVEEGPASATAKCVYRTFRSREREQEKVAEAEEEEARLRRARDFAVQREQSVAKREAETRVLSTQHLERLGIEDKRLRKRAAWKDRRETWCWQCKSPLDSALELEHVVCGWLVCLCGACDCGRPKKPTLAVS